MPIIFNSNIKQNVYYYFNKQNHKLYKYNYLYWFHNLYFYFFHNSSKDILVTKIYRLLSFKIMKIMILRIGKLEFGLKKPVQNRTGE